MDSSSSNAPPPAVEEVQDNWDAEGFLIPIINMGDSNIDKSDVPAVDDDTTPSPKIIKEEQMYFGPHGRPISQGKQQDLKPSGRKQYFRDKLKEADKKYSGQGHENKVEMLQQIVGGNTGCGTTEESSDHDWLDPHCHESQFEKSNQ